MSHVLIGALPFAGHVIPFTGVIRELRQRGHRVSFYTGSKYRDVVERSGASWVPFTLATDFDDLNIEQSFPEMRGRTGLSSILCSFREVFFGTAPQQAHDIANLHAKRPVDVMISEGTCVGPSLAHETLGIPYITMSQAPMALGVPTIIRFAIDHTVNAALTRMHNRIRAQMGLQPAMRPGMEGTWSSKAVVAQGIRQLEGPRRGLPSHITFIGDAAAETRTTDVQLEWLERLPADKPIVHVSQGTLGGNRTQFLEIVARAARQINCHFVVGGAAQPDLPENITAVEWVPQDSLFPKTDLFVTNGGYGGILAALGHGVPMLVIPGGQDKPLAAGNVLRAGAGIRLSARQAATKKLARTINTALQDNNLKAQALSLSQKMKQAGGAGRIADEVEMLLGLSRL